MTVRIRPATLADLPALHPVVECAYRGDSARQGWTHEADLLTGTRIERAELEAIVNDPAQVLLMAEDAAGPLGSVNVARRSPTLAYLGLLSVDPLRQAAGLGKQMLAAAEGHARGVFGADTIEMTVIDRRAELIAWYERRGYRKTGEVRDFPIPLDPPLFMTVLAKNLVPAKDPA